MCAQDDKFFRFTNNDETYIVTNSVKKAQLPFSLLVAFTYVTNKHKKSVVKHQHVSLTVKGLQLNKN